MNKKSIIILSVLSVIIVGLVSYVIVEKMHTKQQVDKLMQQIQELQAVKVNSDKLEENLKKVNEIKSSKTLEVDKINNSIDNYVGVYKCEYSQKTIDSNENQYIVLENINSNLVGRFYGTTDDFDVSREGYFSGFFVSSMKELQIKDNNISFKIELQETDVFEKPVKLNYKTSQEVPISINPRWINSNIFNNNGLEIDLTRRKNPVTYEGKIQNNEIILSTEGGRTFKKVQ